MTEVRSGSVSATIMLGDAALAAAFATATVAVPSMAAELVGGTGGLALAHAFEAAYTAQAIAKIVNPITKGLKKVSESIANMSGGRGNTARTCRVPCRAYWRSTSARAARTPRRAQTPRYSTHLTVNRRLITTADPMALHHRQADRPYRGHRTAAREAAVRRSNITRTAGQLHM
jgi:hypothetical protein